MSVIDGECIRMFVQPMAFFHKPHRWVMGVLGQIAEIVNNYDWLGFRQTVGVIFSPLHCPRSHAPHDVTLESQR